MNTSPPVLLLMGPTASGKSALAMEMASRLNAEIVSVDSAAIYQSMNAGTAKPSQAERDRIPHYLVDIVSPMESYSAERFRQDALRCVADIHARGKRAILAGGTMLYFKALKHGLDILPEANAQVRAKIDDLARQLGWPALHEKLSVRDPITAARLEPNDSQRIQRALEVYELTGKPLSSLHGQIEKHQKATLSYRTLSLMPTERRVLHERIAERFKSMLSAGLVEECRQLRWDYPGLHSALPSMRCVGYRQALEFIDGHVDEATFHFKAVVATRQLAKRQMTWMRSLGNDLELDPLQPDLLQRGLKAGQILMDS